MDTLAIILSLVLVGGTLTLVGASPTILLNDLMVLEGQQLFVVAIETVDLAGGQEIERSRFTRSRCRGDDPAGREAADDRHRRLLHWRSGGQRQQQVALAERHAADGVDGEVWHERAELGLWYYGSVVVSAGLMAYHLWLARNRQNVMSWQMLKTVDLDAWIPYIADVAAELPAEDRHAVVSVGRSPGSHVTAKVAGHNRVDGCVDQIVVEAAEASAVAAVQIPGLEHRLVLESMERLSGRVVPMVEEALGPLAGGFFTELI